MTGRKAIESLESVPPALDLLFLELKTRCTVARERWDRLGRIGGQRDDAAAALLNDVKMQLRVIGCACKGMAIQIAKIQDNPFGDE